MKIINKTGWRTKDLSAIIYAVLDKQRKIEGKLNPYQKKNLEITIVNSRKSPTKVHRSKIETNSEVPKGMEDEEWIPMPRYTGYAYRNGYEMRLRIPSVELCKKYNIEIDVGKFGYLVSHEFDHIRGYKHSDMMDSWERDVPKFRYLDEWYSIKPKKKVSKKKKDKVAERYLRVLSHIEEKTKQIKRLKNSLSKYQKKRKYYERNYSLARLNSKKER